MQDQSQPVIGGGIARGHNNLVLDSFPLFMSTVVGALRVMKVGGGWCLLIG